MAGSVCGMANIAHSGSGHVPARRLTPADARVLRTGLLRTVLFVAAFVAVVALGAQLG